MSRFQFVADNSATFEVKRLCELVEIERSFLLRMEGRSAGPAPNGQPRTPHSRSGSG